MSIPKYKLFLVFLLANLIFQFEVSGQVVINEISCSNRNIIADNYGEYEDWIELYNTGVSPVNLGGYYLSDKLSNTMKWPVPPGVTIPANGRLMFYASGKNLQAGSYLHTNFKLTQTKYEYVILASPFGSIIDTIRLNPAQLNHSLGRTTDGAASWGVFKVPTPGTANTGAYTKYADKPVVSLPAGF